MCDSWVAYCRTRSRRNLHRFYTRAQKSWDQFDEYGFTRATLRHANIRENKGPPLNKIQVKLPHHRSPYAMKFEDRSQKKIERQERCARGDAWRLTKNIYKLKETDKTTTIKLEEREFVVDSGASMQMVSRKDLNSAELETVRI